MNDKPTPLDVPRRPKWRYQIVNNYGRHIVPAAMNDRDRDIIEARRDKIRKYRVDTEFNDDDNRLSDS